MNGTLTLEWSSTVRSFVFDSGAVIHASSNEPGEHVGQILVRAGLLNDETLASALEAQVDRGGSLSHLLGSLGVVNAKELREALEEQAREALLDCWFWPGGTFVFEHADERQSEVDFPIAVRVRGCLVAGRQRMLKWRKVRQVLPADDVDLQVADRTALSTAEDSEERLEEILELVNDIECGMTVPQVIAKRHGRRFGVLECLATLVERGGLAVVERASAVADEPDESLDMRTTAGLEQAARREVARGNVARAYDLARQALVYEPHNPAIQKLFHDIERAFFADLSRNFLTSFRVPRLLVDRARLDDLELSDNERYLAGRIDGRWDLLSLMRVSPLREVEALITFKRLADRGIISL